MVSDFLPFEAHRRGMNAKTGEMLVVGQFTNLAAGCQQCLGGHAAPVHTGSAHVARFDDRRLQTVLGCVFRCVKTAITGTNDDDVEIETGVAHTDCCVEAVILALRRSSRSGTAAAATFNDSTRSL